MHPAISKSYILPAILLNPILFLMSLNTILSRVLPPIIVDAAKQPPPYSTFGPSAQHPHLNIHSSEKLCWSYTFLIVCAQLAAFGRVSECREESKVKVRIKRESTQAKAGAHKRHGKLVYMYGNGHAIGGFESGLGDSKDELQADVSLGTDPVRHLEASDEDSTKTSDSETIL